MSNGNIAVERLVYIQRNLERAMNSVAAEMRHRTQDEDYNERYLSELQELQNKSAKLEDEIRIKLQFG